MHIINNKQKKNKNIHIMQFFPVLDISYGEKDSKLHQISVDNIFC